MQFYFGTSNDFDYDIAAKYNAAVLSSYHYYKSPEKKKFIKDWRATGQIRSLFTDSGAFSAYNLGVNINLDNYCKYLLDIKPDAYAGLDVISDPVKTWENVKYMEREYGLSPIPTYHISDGDFKWLHKMIEEYDYIALGGVVGLTKQTIESFFDRCWSIIMDKKPDLKVHGFGLSTVYFMDKYPWYSADSTSYKSVVRHGDFRFYDKDFRKIKYIYINDYITELYGEEFLLDKRATIREAVRLQFKEFLRLEAYITEKHKTKDFSYLNRKLFG